MTRESAHRQPERTIGAGAADKPAPPAPVAWLLLGDRLGDNNQMHALAAAIGARIEVKHLRYSPLRHVRALRARGMHLTRASRQSLVPPWPDLVIGLGANSIAIARDIRRRSGGRVKLVHIGDPRSAIDDLDLVVTTPQFARRQGKNVLALPFSMGNPAQSLSATAEERAWLGAFVRPRRLIAVGGATRKWKIDERALGGAIRELQAKSSRDGGSVIAVTSPRTSRSTVRLLEQRLRRPADAVATDFPRFGILLAGADEIHVTADSVSMLSEAILTRKPVGMIPIKRTAKGWISHFGRQLGLPYRVDMAMFWRYLHDNRLVGTVTHPIASQAEDSLPTAVAAVRRLLRAPGHTP